MSAKACLLAKLCFALASCIFLALPLHAIWINEIHYDNIGSDAGEFIEIAGAANTDLSSYKLVLYNGNGGVSYKTITLGGTLPDQVNGYGAASFDAAGLQNGSPDGIALVNTTTSKVLQFLSYEGSFSAVGGDADGMLSEDISVFEPNDTPIGSSLQLVGNGSDYSDFTWTGPLAESRNELNSGQRFNAVPETGATIGLLGLSLLSLAAIKQRRRVNQTFES